MAIYMKYSSPQITGGVTTAGYTDQIEISSFQFGLGRSVSSPIGGSSNRESTTPSVSEITLSKAYDEASGGLMKEAYSGAGTATVVISFVRTDANGGVTYLEYTLTDVMLSGYNVSCGGDGKPSESISLNFVTISTRIIPQTKEGSEGTAYNVSYDLGQQKMS